MRVFLFAFRNIVRNWFLSVSTITVLLLVSFFASMLILVEHTTDTLIQRVIERLSLSVYLQKDIPEENPQLQLLMQQIKQVHPNISVEYQSSDTAFTQLQERIPDITAIVESNSDNLLPSKLFVQIRHVPGERFDPDLYQKIDTVIQKNTSILLYGKDSPTYASLVDYQSQYDRVARLITVFDSISWGARLILIVAIFSATAIAYSSIGNMVFAAREEVNIIQLVGWSSWYIYAPFVLQSLMYVVVSIAGASLLAWFCLQAIEVSFLSGYEGFVASFLASRWMEWAWVALTFLLVSALGAWVSVRHSLSTLHGSWSR